MATKTEEWHQVPIDPDYDTCEETRASLLIYPKDLSHESGIRELENISVNFGSPSVGNFTDN